METSSFIVKKRQLKDLEKSSSREAKKSILNTLASNVNFAKQQVDPQNALQWLHVNIDNQCRKVG
jgi:hypothetical protein